MLPKCGHENFFHDNNCRIFYTLFMAVLAGQLDSSFIRLGTELQKNTLSMPLFQSVVGQALLIAIL